MEVLLIFLIAFIIVLFIILYNLKRQIRRISSQIKDINNGDLTNISLSLINEDVVELAAQINRIISDKDELTCKVVKSEKKLKESIGNISHDFRTPLTSIIGYIQLLERSNLDEKQEKNLSTIKHKANDLKILADDFFELAVLDSNDIEPNFKKVNLGNLLSDVVLGNIKTIENANLKFSVNISEKPIFVYADEFMLKRIIQNLISNAIKYATNDFNISLVEEEKVKIKFKNSVDENDDIDVERLFERFYKGDKARGKKGTGLGLSIVKILAEKMSGEVNGTLKNGYLEISVELKK
ncbi:Signal transduction histidine kinase [Clostridium cavendishii DSM 21758]|uniref:histidine kinase n=1 Tax=Clostridium cavendishii DSM 21758 TaxID=1121302 RepID=A0A1M6HZT9_9CLOT|nr:HAMP domain-containing sensor histidine kinase [Clostridium cavendishii]SHJ27604.1 Signal transduction histidine kinase [Clostridium cavendishii DSM 21758]